ncbi:MAG: hypothetical protein DRN61_06245 [Thaumarchaeota archaeon]|nr:MAG: hypothetical protein DRN61_06245 [Nitrososphaerota archaeon]
MLQEALKTMGFVFVAGGGRFGASVIRFFKESGVKTLVVDVNANCSAREHVDFVAENLEGLDFSKGVNMIIADAVDVLIELLSRGVIPEHIVPTMPGHFAGKILKNYLERKGFTITPSIPLLRGAFRKLPKDLAVLVDEINSVIICSYMPFDKKCKTPCVQPTVCPVTGRRKERAMFEILREAAGAANIVCILQSKLIAENIGAFSGEELVKTLSECVRRSNYTIAIGTACKCHGIINFFEVKRADSSQL